ncbi:MAG: hypothetical protein ACERKD_16015 [Prolixibacteraceae bacterium]
MEREKIYNNIDEVLNGIPENYKIMEEIIDLEVQKDYFESTKELVIDVNADRLEDLIDQLHQDETLAADRKILLMKLGMIDAVEAFRAIERYNQNPHQELKDWALLALQQSRMVIQSSLMDEQQVFISTGLGGKDNKLRYYLIFPYNEKGKLTLLQSDALLSELKFFMERNNGIMEELEIQNEYASAMVLLPIKAPVLEIIKEVLAECNQLGNYLANDALITNMKKFSHQEIMEFIQQNE